MTVGSQLAQSALNSMYNNRVESAQDQCRIGLTYDHDIEAKSPDPLDQLVSKTSLAAYDGVQDVYSGLGVLNKALTVMAACPTDKPESVLAQLGLTTMFESHQATAQDQCVVGLAYDHAVANCTPDSTSALVARTSLAAYDKVENVYSGVGVLDAGLAHVVKCQDTPMGTLAATGEAAMHNEHVASAQDQCHIGLVFTQAIRDNTSDASVRTLAQGALDSYGQVEGVYSGLEILDGFLKQVR